MDYQPGNPQNGPGNGYNPYNNPYNNNNPYNPYGAPIQPVPLRHKGESMATVSMVLGIISLLSLFLLRLTIPFLLGGISIILAILSRGGAKKLLSKAKAGITCSVISLTLDISLFAFAIWFIVSLPSFPQSFQDEFNKACEQQYGVSYDELMEDIQDMWENDMNNDIWNDFNY